jgi:hypothetical protein
MAAMNVMAASVFVMGLVVMGGICSLMPLTGLTP